MFVEASAMKKNYKLPTSIEPAWMVLNFEDMNLTDDWLWMPSLNFLGRETQEQDSWAETNTETVTSKTRNQNTALRIPILLLNLNLYSLCKIF